MGGEGVAYHDTDVINKGSGELNRQPSHCRPGTPEYFCYFREKESVDISYTKDFADFNHPNLVAPEKNQLYLGWEADGEWVNYTVNVKKAGTYSVNAMYGNLANTVTFSVNNRPAGQCKLPVATGSFHNWNKAMNCGEVTFPQAGMQLLTLHYNAGNNLAYFEFAPTRKE
ncbi:MAG: carbohydrate-binding protein [Candidatus Solibacter sp.]|nr:carbohydrate-binding protein [Candidatus Solibacter sp.]